jgi:hypothetical protein
MVMHMACFPHRYTGGQRALTGGLGVNLIVAREHRALLPALALLRRLIADTRDLGFDFLYADPNEQGRAALKLAGFGTLGSLERFVLPLAGRNPLESLAVAAYGAWRSVLAGGSGVSVQDVDAGAFDESAWASTPLAGRLVPVHPPFIYRRRLEDYPSPADRWITAGDSAALLVRGPDKLGSATIWDIRRKHGANLTPLIAAAAAAMRRRGALRLQTWTLLESTLADELRRAGMLPRNDLTPVMLLPLSDAGAAAARTPQGWHMTSLDCDR